MLYMIYGVDGPDADRIRADNREAHFAYLAENEDILVLGGATLADDDDARTGSLLVINVPSRADADRFATGEPFNKAGLFSAYTVSRMRRGQWNPAAAPSSAEGN
ncbi:MAG: YciI family protein [Alphaproteobacteria bacterium]